MPPSISARTPRPLVPPDRQLAFICRGGSLGCHPAQSVDGSRDCSDEPLRMAAAHLYKLAWWWEDVWRERKKKTEKCVFNTNVWINLLFLNHNWCVIVVVVVVVLTCPGKVCPVVYLQNWRYPESFSWLLRILPPAGPETSAAWRDGRRTQNFLLCHYLKDASKCEFGEGAQQAGSRPGLRWRSEQVTYPNSNWTS